MKKDYSEWITRERLIAEEVLWKKEVKEGKGNALIAKHAQMLCIRYGLKTVIEVGCGTAWIPTLLKNVMYVGLDANPICLEYAKRKNPNHLFVGPIDFREFKTENYFDLVICFSTLKHFKLHEWVKIYQKVLSLGRYSIVTMNIAQNKFSQRAEFTHSWVTMQDIRKATKEVRHRIIHKEGTEHV